MTIKFEPNSGKNCVDKPLARLSSTFGYFYAIDDDLENLLHEIAKYLDYKIIKRDSKCFQGYCYAVGCKNERMSYIRYCNEHIPRDIKSESEHKLELRIDKLEEKIKNIEQYIVNKEI